jgi:hypothetical protein
VFGAVDDARIDGLLQSMQGSMRAVDAVGRSMRRKLRFDGLEALVTRLHLKSAFSPCFKFCRVCTESWPKLLTYVAMYHYPSVTCMELNRTNRHVSGPPGTN